jgi:hypothetical protein
VNSGFQECFFDLIWLHDWRNVDAGLVDLRPPGRWVGARAVDSRGARVGFAEARSGVDPWLVAGARNRRYLQLTVPYADSHLRGRPPFAPLARAAAAFAFVRRRPPRCPAAGIEPTISIADGVRFVPVASGFAHSSVAFGRYLPMICLNASVFRSGSKSGS